MPDDDSLKTLLQRICDLEEQQLRKLSELVEHYSVLAKGGQRNDELFHRNAQLWEQDHKMYVERAHHAARHHHFDHPRSDPGRDRRRPFPLISVAHNPSNHAMQRTAPRFDA
jgi:hypothetical protein